jgi:hypothetical protein
MRTIRVYAQDQNGYPLIHSSISAFSDSRRLGRIVDSRGQATFGKAPPGPIRVVVEYEHEGAPLVEERLLADTQDHIEIRFGNVDIGRPGMDFLKQNFPALLGLFLLVLGVVLGFVFSTPTPLQIFLIRALVALGAGGVASVIPGFLKIDVGLGTKLAISAGGALAVLLLMYIFNPPELGGASGVIPVGELTNSSSNSAAPVTAIENKQ